MREASLECRHSLSVAVDVVEGVKDIVLFSPSDGEQLQLDGLVMIDIRDNVVWTPPSSSSGQTQQPRNAGPPRRRSRPIPQGAKHVEIAWLDNFA